MVTFITALACRGDPPAATPPERALAPTDSAAVIGPGIISTAAPEFAATFTPDGLVLYFNRSSEDRRQIDLMESGFRDGTWSAPEPVSFSGGHRNVDPFVTPDGTRLYFSSTRPTSDGEDAGDFNTWYVERNGDAWGEPMLLPSPVNTESQEVFVSLDAARNLFFASDRDGVMRIYRSRWSSDGHGTPELLAFDANQQEGAGNPLVMRDGRMLIFVSVREGGYGGADLHATCESEDGWSPAVNLGAGVNSAFADFAPGLTADGEYLLFTSERPVVAGATAEGERPPGDLYYVPLARLDIPCRSGLAR